MTIKKTTHKHGTLLFCLISAGLTVLVLSLVFMRYGLFPFGQKTLAWGDMKQQVIPLLLDFKDILSGEANMLLNLQNAGGMSFWGIFFFFLSSPFSFLVLLIEKSEIYLLVNLMVFLKLTLCAACAGVFFASYKKLSGFFVVLFSVSYAFCGFGLLYYQNILWLDLMCLFPLTMLSLKWVLEKKRAFAFSLFLTFTVVLCYYLSFMVFLSILLFIGIYCLFCLRDKQEKRRICRVTAVSVLTALGITAVVWLPSFLQICHSARTQSVLKGLLHANLLTNFNTNLPVFYCTALLFAAVYLLKNATWTPLRIGLLSVFLLTIIPLFIDPVNKMWHMGSYQAFPARYGYITVFAGLWLAVDILSEHKIEKQALRRPPLQGGAIFLTFALSIGYGIWLIGFGYDKLLSYNHSLWFNAESTRYLLAFALVSALAAILLLRHMLKGFPLRRLCAGMLMGLVLFESFVFSCILIGGSANTSLKEKTLLEGATPLQTTNICRVKANTDRYSVNLLGAMGFPTLDHYTSLTDDAYYKTVKKLGYSAYWMETSSYGGTAISDLFLSHKYCVEENGAIHATGAPFNLGIITKKETLPGELPANNRLLTQNQLFQAVTGKRGIHFYPPEKKTDGDGLYFIYTIPVTQKETLYFDAFSLISNRLREKINDSMELSVNGTVLRESYPTQRDNGILTLGTFENQTVTVQVNFIKKENARYVTLGGLKEESFQLLCDSLSDVSSFSQGNSLTFEATAQTDDQTLFLSIPYYAGMKVTVNGIETQVHSVMGSFFEVPLGKGNNQVILTYIPQGLVAGLLITCGTILLVIALLIWRNCTFVQKLSMGIEKISYPLMGFLFFAAVACVYILPVLISLL